LWRLSKRKAAISIVENAAAKEYVKRPYKGLYKGLEI
jgi:hypothetical protein